MAKNYSKRNKTRKSLIAALCVLSVTCTGLAAACTPEEEQKDPPASVKEDTQLLKNGNFEFFNVPDKAVYLINNVNDWSLNGDSSVKSGIIGTGKTAWDKLTAGDLKDKLDYNNDLSASDDNYVDYNSMASRDLLYKDSYAALLKSDDVAESLIKLQGYETYFGITEKDGKYYIGETEVYKNSDDGEYYFDTEFTNSVRNQLINNPETHLGAYSEKDGKIYLGSTQVYADDDGNLYTDEAKENLTGNVLMLHNYATDGKNNGIHQYYTSSTITLEANTAAEISLWVKTSNLKFDKGYSALDEQDKGAYIELVQTVSGTSVESVAIKNINTEKIIKYSGADYDNVKITSESNGWLQYTIYVNACDFAQSSIQLRLGLGNSEQAEKCTGYAFFDDVEVKRYRTLEESSYKDNKDKITEATSCTLTDEAEDKVFIADRELRDEKGDESDYRNSYNFHYSVDLASETGTNSYNSVPFGTNVKASLTTERKDGKVYASAATNEANLSGVIPADENGYSLVKGTDARPTKNDLIGVFNAKSSFTSALFNGTDYSKVLTDALTGENAISKLPRPADSDNMLVMLSAWGAAYTSTVTDTAFTLEAGEYRLVSFWVKTSDMDGKTAATIKVYDFTDKDNNQTITVDTTGVATDFEEDKDIYKGWAQCFVFVKNDTKNSATFNIDFSFGNTTITDAESFNGGWAAFAKLQSLNIDEDIYNLASKGDRTALFTFSESKKDNSGFEFDDATGTSDIKKEISNLSNYSGLNGANSSITNTDSKQSYDNANTNKLAGLISGKLDEENNRTYAEGYDNWATIATSFATASSSWNDVFGKDCVQPLIIINNLRTYADRAEATETTYSNYYVLVEDENDYDNNNDVVTANGRHYTKATEWDETATYYSLSEVVNYGFAGETKTVSADSYETISVKVKVSGDAVAYIYLVDANNPSKLLGYSTPDYTFNYDVEGNVLDAEYDENWKESDHRSHIVYTLRTDGLYEDKDGKLFANLNNLVKSYRNYKFEHNTFYNSNKEAVSFDKLVNGETYYSDANATVLANHYLTSTNGTRIYEYDNGVYYYLVNGERNAQVSNFDTSLARYDYKVSNEEFFVKVTNTNGKWKTVNFYIHTGSEAKSYRLELWSGARGETGITAGDNKEWANGAVAFDNSSYSVTSSNYSTLIGEYEKNIIDAYKALLISKEKLDKVSSNTENIAYFEQTLVKDGVLTQEEVDGVKAQFGYNAKYYSYTLYDSEAYVPFNANTAAEGETGYNYKVTDFGETLAYLVYDNEKQNSHNVFVDYSAVDQSIEISKANDSEDDNNEENTTPSGDLWLYISSIILVVALFITMLSILIKKWVKEIRKKKGVKSKNKNVYRQRDRYIRKLHLVKNEEETQGEESETEESVEEETPAEETETVETTNETAEEVPSEENNVTEEAPAEDSVATETNAEENKDGE